jgi:hypothetical protein
MAPGPKGGQTGWLPDQKAGTWYGSRTKRRAHGVAPGPKGGHMVWLPDQKAGTWYGSRTKRRSTGWLPDLKAGSSDGTDPAGKGLEADALQAGKQELGKRWLSWHRAIEWPPVITLNQIRRVSNLVQGGRPHPGGRNTGNQGRIC